MGPATIGFVWGYLPYIDIRSKIATEACLKERFSIAFDRYPDSGPRVYNIEFNKDIIVGVLAELLKLFDYDSLIATDWENKHHSSVNQACLYDAEDESWYPLTSIRLLKNGVTVCYVEHEAYQTCGGPHPYHDAFVYAFYFNGLDRSHVQKTLSAYAISNNITILDMLSGCKIPIKRPWYKELWRWFTR